MVAENAPLSTGLTSLLVMTQQPKNIKQFVNWEQVSLTKSSSLITTH
jgi:hypothetical protein